MIGQYLFSKTPYLGFHCCDIEALVYHVQNEPLPTANSDNENGRVVCGSHGFESTVDRNYNVIEGRRQRLVSLTSPGVNATAVASIAAFDKVPFKRHRPLLVLTGIDHAIALLLSYDVGREARRL